VADPSGDVETIRRLNNTVRGHPEGISISKLARQTGINRNSVAKYLEIMLANGQVEMKTVGAAKIYYPARKIPISSIADNFPEIIIVVDAAGEVLLANKSCEAFFGLSRGKLAGRPLREARLAGMPETFFEAVHDGIAGAFVEEEFLVGCNGKTAHLNGKFIPTALEAGKDGLIIFLEDITGERRSKILLQASESKFRTLFNNSCAMIFVHSLPQDGKPGMFIEVNTYACEKLGYSREELLSMTVTDLFGGSSWITGGSSALNQLQQSECLRRERELFDKNGNKIPVEVYSHLIEFGGEQVALSVLLDRTYKIKYEEKILENLKNLEYLSQMALSFLDFPEDEDPYEFVADQLCTMCPGVIVVIDAVDERTGEWQNKAVRGLENYDLLLEKFLPDDPRGERLITKNKGAFLSSGKLVHIDKTSLLELLENGKRREFIDAMAGYGYEDFYKMALLRDDSPAGMVIISIPRESSITNPELVEAFLNQAVVALGKHNAELHLKRANETLMQKLVEHERQQLKFQEILNISGIERREIEKSLHGQMELTRRCLELMNIALVTVRENGTIVGANTSACDMLETSPSELIGKNWFDDVLSGGAGVHARRMHQKIAQNPRYSGILTKPVNRGISGKREMVWMIRRCWECMEGAPRIIWLGEEMPGVRVLELSKLT
jgi:PAS domain S-box-containing protein